MKTARILLPAAAIAAALFAAGPGAAKETPASHDSCFLSRDWQGWSAPGDGDTLYLRVGVKDIYKVGLTPGTRVHRSPDRFLLVSVRGSSWICRPIDLDLSLSDHFGMREPLIARSLQKLTPQQVAAIPKKDLPY